MTEVHPAHSTGGASRDDEGATTALGLAEWLCLAATPTFAIMACSRVWAGARWKVLFVRARGAAGGMAITSRGQDVRREPGQQ